mgnify:CR=1 FL=1
MYFIDTHSHIYYDKYNDDLDSVINKSIDHNVKKIICVGVDIESSIKSIKIAEKYDCVYATVGYHPHESKDTIKNYLYELEELSKHEKVVAIGETGLDYYYEHSNKTTQLKVFNEQLELANTLKMPVIIHNRNSDNDIIQCLIKESISNGVIHCFASNIEFAHKIIKQGLKISFTGLITFVKELEKVVLDVPINKIMLETDSPYLTPIPYRGKRNEPYMIKFIAEKISQIKNIPLEEVRNQTTQTAKEFFGI